MMRKNEKKRKTIDEAAIDQIVAEAKTAKNLKEQIYDRINIPVWVLDILITVLCIALFYIILFKRA